MSHDYPTRTRVGAVGLKMNFGLRYEGPGLKSISWAEVDGLGLRIQGMMPMGREPE